MMIKTEFKILRLLLYFGLSFCSLTIFAQGNGNTLTVTSKGSLEFGRFSRINGGNITIDPNGAVNKTGDIFLVSSLRSNVSFDISTNRANTNMVTVTASPTPLTGPGGSLELSVIFDKNPFIIDKDNPATVNMGGTISIGPEDSPGIYSGTVTVIFAYQ